jgi:hypothetical protein
LAKNPFPVHLLIAALFTPSSLSGWIHPIEIGKLHMQVKPQNVTAMGSKTFSFRLLRRKKFLLYIPTYFSIR